MKIKIAGLISESIVDGPGIRFTIFTQGCPHNCEGCHNPETHDYNGGRWEDTDNIFEMIKKDPILDGVTFSGGDPFCQCKPLAELAQKIHSHKEFKMNVMAYTGYRYEYLVSHANEDNGFMELLKNLDYLVDGPFVLSKRSLELKFMGSSNQRYIDVQKSLEQGKVVELTQDQLSLM